MFHVLARIDVQNFEALAAFEQLASKIMQDHEGKIIRAFETVRNPDNSGEEIHLLEFSSAQHFNRYREDIRLGELKELRAQAISNIEIKTSSLQKFY